MNPSQPIVSIVINNYNYDRFLAKAIESALNQTYSQVEVIVVDDGSTDCSVSIIESYGDRVTPVLKENGGQASAINAGVLSSQGEIVVLLDADDYLFPNAVEQVVAAWQPGVVQVQCRLKLVDIEGNYIDLYPKPEIPFDGDDVLKLLLERGRYRTTVTSGLSFSRAVLTQILPIPEVEFRISADGYLVTVAPFYGQVISIDQPLGARCQHGENFWSFSAKGNVAEKLRKAVQHDFLRYKYLIQKASEMGQSVSEHCELKDYIHLTNRIASLGLDPGNHPVPSDSKLALAYLGYRSIWQYSRFSWSRKLILSSWFLWVGIMPPRLIRPAIHWLLFPTSRSKNLDRLTKKVRLATS